MTTATTILSSNQSTVMCHVALPYKWVECVNGDACRSLVHYEGVPEELNNTPYKWLSTLLGFSYGRPGLTRGIFLGDVNKLHRLDGPVIEDENGSCYWYVNGVLRKHEGVGVRHYGERTQFLVFAHDLWPLDEASVEYSRTRYAWPLMEKVLDKQPDGSYEFESGSVLYRVVSVVDCAGCDKSWCGV